MTRWRVLVVEDEEPARRMLRRYLGHFPDLEVEEASDGETALEKLQSGEWDIVLLDIEMPGLNGLSLMHYAASLPKPPAVIFTTAYSEHAVKAFEGGAVDYLLKPFSLDRLRQALQRAQERSRSSSGFSTSSQGGVSSVPRLPLPRAEGHRLLEIPDIFAVRVEDRALYLELCTGETLTTRAYTLQQLEERFPKPPFLRIARDTLINLNAVQEVLPWFSGRHKVVLRTGTIYLCSREYAPQLLKALGIKGG